jgi:hypothetical protein
MNGSTYDWPDPDASLFDGITHAASPGRWYNENLRGRSGASPSVPRATSRVAAASRIAMGIIE